MESTLQKWMINTWNRGSSVKVLFRLGGRKKQQNLWKVKGGVALWRKGKRLGWQLTWVSESHENNQTSGNWRWMIILLPEWLQKNWISVETICRRRLVTWWCPGTSLHFPWRSSWWKHWSLPCNSFTKKELLQHWSVPWDNLLTHQVSCHVTLPFVCHEESFQGIALGPTEVQKTLQRSTTVIINNLQRNDYCQCFDSWKHLNSWIAAGGN
jgi:hypothetical protein